MASNVKEKSDCLEAVSMATSKDPVAEGDGAVPPPYESVVSQPVAMTKTVGEMGYTYPPGYSAVPLQQTHLQGSSPSGAQHIPAPYYYPPQTLAPPSSSALTTGGPVNYVIVNQPTPSVVQTYGGLQPLGHKPPNFMCLSLVTCLCFNWMFGLVALAFSCHSDTAYAAGDSQRARLYGKYAFYLNVTGIFLSAMFTVMLFALF